MIRLIEVFVRIADVITTTDVLHHSQFVFDQFVGNNIIFHIKTCGRKSIGNFLRQLVLFYPFYFVLPQLINDFFMPLFQIVFLLLFVFDLLCNISFEIRVSILRLIVGNPSLNLHKIIKMGNTSEFFCT